MYQYAGHKKTFVYSLLRIYDARFYFIVSFDNKSKMSRRNRSKTPTKTYKTINDIDFNYAKETHSLNYRPNDRDDRKKYNMECETSSQAFALAKHCNGIDQCVQPFKQTRIPDRNNAGQNCIEYQFRNNDGNIIVIRKDNPTEYENAAGNQKGHYNAGLEGTNLDQHYSFDQDN